MKVMEADRITELKAELREAEEEIERLKSENGTLVTDLADAEKRADENVERAELEISDTVSAFLDEIERPVGKLNFIIPQSPAVDRAVLALYDAIGRKI